MAKKGKRSETKRERLNRMKQSHILLNPGVTCDFMCPICLGQFAFDDPNGATEAHIVPKAAGGRMTTFLCKTCNSNAGASIDKWYGEHVRLKDGSHSVFDTKFKTGRVRMGGIELGGDIRTSATGGLEVLLFKDRSHPENLRALDRLSTKSGIGTVEVKIPLLAKHHEINIGALQAGYLWLVRLFGYVPVYQRSLDQVRQQLMNPKEALLGKQFVAKAKAELKNRGIGAAEIDGNRCIFVLVGELIVFLPTVDGHALYSSLPKNYAKAKIRAEALFGKDIPDPEQSSFGLIIGNEIWLWPDKLQEPYGRIGAVYLEGIGSEGVFLSPCSREQALALEKEHGVAKISIRAPLSDP